MIKTVSGIVQEYAERLRNERGFTKLDSASCPRPSGRAVLPIYAKLNDEFASLHSGHSTECNQSAPKVILNFDIFCKFTKDNTLVYIYIYICTCNLFL